MVDGCDKDERLPGWKGCPGKQVFGKKKPQSIHALRFAPWFS
jgi:hypothetical protein